jgi:polysaccharide biosynthesis protein VpsM
MTKGILPLALLGALATFAHSANAQSSRGIHLGGMRVVPSIGLTFANDDNVKRTPDREISSFVTTLSPGIRLEGGDDTRGAFLSYEIEAARYADSSDDNYTDHDLQAGLNLNSTDRSKLNVNAGYARKHDFRGAGAQQGGFLSTKPDRYNLKSISGEYDYGADGARLGFGLEAGLRTTDYTNNRAYTIYRDLSEDYIGGNLNVRLAPKTRAFVSARFTNVDFDLTRPLRVAGTNAIRQVNFDSKEREYLVGMRWDATAKASGHVGVGRIQKRFVDSTFGRYSGFGWEAGVQFRPRTYSIFDLTTTRQTDESDDIFRYAGTGLGTTASLGANFILRRDVTLAWTHGWTERFKSNLDFGFTNDSYREVDFVTRDDDGTHFGLGANYLFRPWLSLGAAYKSYKRDSNEPLFDYNRHLFLFSLEATL